MAAPAVVIKKGLAATAGNSKGKKAIATILLVILLLLILPLISVLAFFNMDISVDEQQLVSQAEAELTSEERMELQRIDSTFSAIENAMAAREISSRCQEAQALFFLALVEPSREEGFVEKLADCYAENPSDAQLVAAVNRSFGTTLHAEDYTALMKGLRSVCIDISGFTDPATKNHLDLVQWAIAAERQHWGYVWGTYGQVLTEELLKAKLEQYPEDLGSYEVFIREHWLGGRTADCVGLIKGYGWLNADSLQIEYGSNGMPDLGSDAMYENATVRGELDTMPEVPGLAVWKEGHIGIYIGNGEVIHASSTRVGVVKTPLSASGWTHWLQIPYIYYPEGAET